jgi:hypothetical protein
MGACGLAGPMRTAEKKVRKMYGGADEIRTELVSIFRIQHLQGFKIPQA